MAELAGQSGNVPGPDAWEATNAHLVASALVSAAALRHETRGCHWREDFPEADEAFRGHLISHLTPTGELATSYEALAP